MTDILQMSFVNSFHWRMNQSIFLIFVQAIYICGYSKTIRFVTPLFARPIVTMLYTNVLINIIPMDR